MNTNNLLPFLFLMPLTAFSQTNDIKAMIDSLRYMKADTLDCSADLFWRIIAQKQNAIPFLIEKLNDTTETNISFHCKKTKLNVGEVAYFALNKIAEFPAFLVTQIQFDVIDNSGCWSFYEYLFDNSNKINYRQKVRNWWIKNQFRYKEEKIPLIKLTPCERRYKFDTYYRWIE